MNSVYSVIWTSNLDHHPVFDWLGAVLKCGKLHGNKDDCAGNLGLFDCVALSK